MVDVQGLERFKWRLTEKTPCTLCMSHNVVVLNAEWCMRESLTRILKNETEQFDDIFETFKDIIFYATTKNVMSAINKRETLGVYTIFLGYELFQCPVLVGSKMFSLITKFSEVNYNTWKSHSWHPLKYLFCDCDNRNQIKPTLFIVRGKIYTLGQLACKNY